MARLVSVEGQTGKGPHTQAARQSPPRVRAETARDCFLDMMESAAITENTDAEITPEGRYIDRTTYTITVSNRDLAILIDALGLDHRMTETTLACIRRHIAATTTQAAE